MAQSIEDFVLGDSQETQQESQTVTIQPTTVETPTIQEFVEFGGSEVQKEQSQIEEGLILKRGGLPDNGRVLQDPKTKLLHYVSSGYATSNQDEIKQILDNASKGDIANPTQDAISRGKQWFFEEKMPSQVEQYYGLPKGLGTPAKEAGLLSQQFLSGGAGSGTWWDDILTGDKEEKQRYERIRQDYASEYPERAIPAQLAGLGTSIYGGSLAFKELTGAKSKFDKLKSVVDNARKWYQGLPPRMQDAVKIGGGTVGAGVEGLIYGAGKGDTTEERAMGAVTTSGMNMMITAPLMTAFPIVGSLINRYKPVQQQVESIATEFGIGIESARMLKDAFESGLSLSDMMLQVERSGDKALIVDATKAFESLLDASKTSGAASTEKVDRAITGRVEDTSGVLQHDIDTALGVKPEGTQTIIEKVSKDTAGARSDAYDKAYDHVIDFSSDVGQQIKSVLKRVDPIDMEKALIEANKSLRDKGLQQFQIMVKFDRHGNLSVAKDLNFIQLDYIKRGLDALGREVDNFGMPTPSAIRSRGQASDLRNALVESNPAYGEALSISQGKILTQEAITLGSKLLNKKTTLDEVKRMVKKASKNELAGARQGIREQIENIMSNAKTASGQKTASEVKEAMSLVNELSSRANKEKLRLILGEKTANALLKRVDEVKKALEVQGGVRLGSPTQPRQEIAKQVESLAGGGGIRSFSLGDPKTSVARMRDFFTGRDDYLRSQTEQIYGEMVDVLTSSEIKGKTVKQALQYLDKVRKGETLTEPQASWLVGHIKRGLESQGVAIGVGIGSQRQVIEQ